MQGSNPDVQQTDDGNTEYTASRDTSDADCNRVDIEKTANGGFTARKFCKPQDTGKGSNFGYQEPEMYAFASFDELSAFLSDAFGAGQKSGSDASAPPAMTPNDTDA